MKLSIEHMVCARCVESVRELFDDLDIPLRSVDLGKVDTVDELEPERLEQVSSELQNRGFALVKERSRELVTEMNSALIAYLNEIENEQSPKKLSTFLTGRLPYNYAYLSKLYSDQEGVTLEHELIRLKIERVKELLDARNRTLSEIAWVLNYSSVQYLSNQFKKMTGETVTEYLERGESDRKGYDRV